MKAKHTKKAKTKQKIITFRTYKKVVVIKEVFRGSLSSFFCTSFFVRFFLCVFFVLFLSRFYEPLQRLAQCLNPLKCIMYHFYTQSITHTFSQFSEMHIVNHHRLKTGGL
ncbi:MAG: hypothetical protein EAZ92_08350 [Candidatus Kapaibacterium sp.]|nr:MAG: hypothetical protein EAZ92_08350 [Candidatus Kapabacteria bacterium]